MFVGIFIGLKPSEYENYYAQRFMTIQLFFFEEENVNSRLAMVAFPWTEFVRFVFWCIVVMEFSVLRAILVR